MPVSVDHPIHAILLHASARPTSLRSTYPFSSRRSLAIQPFTTVDLWNRRHSFLLGGALCSSPFTLINRLVILSPWTRRRLEQHPHPDPAQIETRNTTSLLALPLLAFLFLGP
jgi:hypothetical protein